MSEELMCWADTTPTISVIMPAYNAAHYLERSLPPLMEMLERGTVSEVIVVDDCSTEASTAELARRGGARTIRTPGNGGPGAARNLGAKEAVGQILWFVDADVIAYRDGPERIRRALADHTVCAVFGSYDDFAARARLRGAVQESHASLLSSARAPRGFDLLGRLRRRAPLGAPHDRAHRSD